MRAILAVARFVGQMSAWEVPWRAQVVDEIETGSVGGGGLPVAERIRAPARRIKKADAAGDAEAGQVKR